MSKGKKIVVLLFLVLSMITLFSVLISYQSSVELPFFLIPLSEYPIIGKSLQLIIFYLAIFLLFIVIVCFCVILFYPQKMTYFSFEKSLGSLIITKKAIEGIVKEKLQKKQLMLDPSVTAKMSRRKIKIVVKGNLIASKELYSKSDKYSEEVEEELHQLIGSDVKIYIRLKFVALKNKTKSRVG